jgi:hypothetical protein
VTWNACAVQIGEIEDYMDDIAQQGACQTRSKPGTPARLIMRCFQAEAPLATRGLRDAPPSNLRKTIEIVPGERPTSLPIAAAVVVNCVA